MYVVGIDYSSHAVDLVWLDQDADEWPWHVRYDLRADGDAFERTRVVADVMPGRSSKVWDDVLAFGIEHPGGKHGTRDMMRVQGAVLSRLPSNRLVKPWPPAQWKKHVGLTGNATKPDVRDLVVATLGESVAGWPQDACDAYCIAVATSSLEVML